MPNLYLLRKAYFKSNDALLESLDWHCIYEYWSAGCVPLEENFLLVWDFEPYSEAERLDLVRSLAPKEVGVVLAGRQELCAQAKQLALPLRALAYLCTSQPAPLMKLTLDLVLHTQVIIRDLSAQLKWLRNSWQEQQVVNRALHRLALDYGWSEQSGLRWLGRQGLKGTLSLAEAAQKFLDGELAAKEAKD